jgi:hypothetical protein
MAQPHVSFQQRGPGVQEEGPRRGGAQDQVQRGGTNGSALQVSPILWADNVYTLDRLLPILSLEKLLNYVGKRCFYMRKKNH